jgi:hypothetical protein
MRKHCLLDYDAVPKDNIIRFGTIWATIQVPEYDWDGSRVVSIPVVYFLTIPQRDSPTSGKGFALF